MNDAATQPTIRIRIQHSHTLKEGWRLSETTVEYTGPADSVDHHRIELELRSAFQLGTAEQMLRSQ